MIEGGELLDLGNVYGGTCRYFMEVEEQKKKKIETWFL